MNSNNLNNLIKTGQLKKEKMNKDEFLGLFYSGKNRLKDALNESLSPESRFDLAYNAAHSFALAALRYAGYRSSNRYIVFQVLPQTLTVDSTVWRILSKCHDKRNLAEYEGHFEEDERLFNELIESTKILFSLLETRLNEVQ